MTARLVFYYGIPIEKVQELDVDDYATLVHGLTSILSEQQMYLLEATSFPNLKPQDRSKIHKKHHKIAFPYLHKKRSLSSEDVAKILSGRL